MKAKQIAKARKRITAKGYWAEREAMYAKRLVMWRHFEQFQCSAFFKGSAVAERNCEIYNREYPRCYDKHNWYYRKCMEYHEQIQRID